MNIKAIKNLNQILTLSSAFEKDGRHLVPSDLSILNDGAIIFDLNKIIWVGTSSEIPSQYQSLNWQSMPNHCLTPELVDSHTHLVFGGNRSFEYTMKINGESYESIAQNGGGILFSTLQTRQSSFDQLFNIACKHIEKMYLNGVGTIEIKSGYGLNFDEEKKISLVIDQLKQVFKPKINIINTYMAAHAIGSEFKDSQSYLNQVVLPLLEELHSLSIIDFVDIFHEKNYFNDIDASILFQFCKDRFIPLKIHADELNDNNGAKLAYTFEAVSADHLLKINDSNIINLASSSTVATLLPGTALFLGKSLPPARKILDAGGKVNIASDFNPGSCHWPNLLEIARISGPSLKMNIAELWSSITLNAAHALDIRDQGAILAGLKPRFTLFQCNSIDDIFYSWGQSLTVLMENKEL